MQEKENLEELFKEAFQNYEEPVRPELWTKISNSIQTAPTGVDPSAAVNSTISPGSGLLSGAAVWVTGAALVALTGIGIYYISKQNSPNQPVIEKIDVSENIIGTQPISEQSVPTENTVNPEQEIPKSNPASQYKIAEKNPDKAPSTSDQKNSQTSIIAEHSQVSSGQQNAEIQHQDQQDATVNTPNPKSAENSKPTPSNSENSSTIKANLRANPISGTAPLMVDFSYGGDALRTEWTFGDGVTSSQLNLVKHTFEKPGNYTVTLKVYDEAGLVTLLNQTIKVQSDLQIDSIPNRFTPNGDGFNDVFKFNTSGLASLEVKIYDQGGKIVKIWTGLEGEWDGKLNSGDLAPVGTYIYTIFATDENQQIHKQKGIITLTR